MRGAFLLAAALLAFQADAAVAAEPDEVMPTGIVGVLADPAAPRPAKAPRPVAARVLRPVVNDQPGFGRLTMPAAGKGGYRVTRQDDRVVIEHPRGARIGPAGTPRNVAAVTSLPNRTELVLRPGAVMRSRMVRGGLVVEILDPPVVVAAPVVVPVVPVVPVPATPPAEIVPPAVVAVAPPAVPPPAEAPPVVSAPVVSVPVVAAPPVPVVPPPVPAPVFAPGSVRIEAVAGGEPAILLPAAREVGLAAFRTGSDMLVVLDAAIDYRPVEPVLDPGFAAMTSQRTQDATVLRIPGAAGALRVGRDARGWVVTLGRQPDSIAGILARPMQTGPGAVAIRLAVSGPSRVVTVLDPQTGARLLVGTQTMAGEAVLNERMLVQFRLLATFQGVAASAASDDIGLRREGSGFTLFAGAYTGGRILADSDLRSPNAPEMKPQSTLFDLPNDSVQALARKLGGQIRASAEAPAMARSNPRLRVAETMVALGMGVEAQSVLDIAAAEDPALRDTPRVMGLRSVAAILAHRLEGADGLADPRLTGTIEVDLWRALLKVARDQAGEAEAAGLASAVRLLMGYPATLRDRLLPEAVEFMAVNGQVQAAQAALKARPEDGGLDLARAMVLEMTGPPAAALKAYDEVAGRSDRLPRYKAMVRAVELRMKSGQLDARAGADALDQALFGWRGAHQELKLRFRIAELRSRSGQWRDALTVLRDGREAFPEDVARIDGRIAEVFTTLLDGDNIEGMPPADFVALYDQNFDLVQTMAWSGPVAAKLAAHLTALGLQGRAEPIMVRLLAQTRDPAERSMLGTRLASLRMTLDNPAGAIAALAQTTPPAGIVTDPSVMEARQLLYSRAESERGNKDVALTMLGLLDSAEAYEIRADIYTGRQDWLLTIAALTALEAKRIATPGVLDPAQQALLMRLTVAATLGNDATTLARLAATYGKAMGEGPGAARFRLMTSPPVTGAGDLPRAFEEIELARRLRGGVASRP